MKKIYTIVILFSFCMHSYAFEFIAIRYQYTEMSGGTVINATGTNGYEDVTIPFQINMQGSYNIIRVSVNGWLNPGANMPPPGNENNLAGVPFQLIAPLWDDMNADASTVISYKIEGNFPYRRFVVQWKGVLWIGQRQNFQAILHEIDGSIEFVYGVMNLPASPGSASIGVASNGMFISITPPPSTPGFVPPQQPTSSMFVSNNGIQSAYTLNGYRCLIRPSITDFKSVADQDTGYAAAGSFNQKIMKLEVIFGDALASYSVKKFVFKTTGTTIKNNILRAKLFTTGASPHFNNEIQIGNTIESPQDSFMIEGNQMIGRRNYFWLTYDISTSALPGEKFDAVCEFITMGLTGLPSGMLYPVINSNPPAYVEVRAGVSGAFTIGNGGSFPNIKNAIDSIGNKILSGPVELILLSSYNASADLFPIKLKGITGTSSERSITIKPAANAGSILFGGSNTIFELEDANNIIIDGGEGEKITFAMGYNSAIEIKRKSFNNIVRRCVFKGLKGIEFISGEYEGTGNNIIENCSFVGTDQVNGGNITFKGGIIGIHSGNIIRNNEFRNSLSYAVSLNSPSLRTRILNNKIWCEYSSMVYGIRAENAIELRIEKNRILNLTDFTLESNGSEAISLYSSQMSDAYIYNNFISLNESPFHDLSAIKITGQGMHVSIINNTIKIGGVFMATRNSYALFLNSPDSYMSVWNNIIENSRTNDNLANGKNYVVYSLSGGLSLNYNSYYSAAPLFGRYNSQDYSSFTAWQQATNQDGASNFKKHHFISAVDPHLTGSSLGDLSLIGKTFQEITDDIDGEPRDPFYPYRGADENLQNPLPVLLEAFYASVNGNDVHIHWITATEINNAGFLIEKRIEDEWKGEKFIEGKGTTTERSEYSYLDKELPAGKYYYRLKQIDRDGTYDYSDVLEVNVGTPELFMLHQNYPNPFNPVTTVEYSLAEEVDVEIKLYNVLGKEVMVLVKEKKDTGKYKAELNGAALATGVYFCKMKAGFFNATIKLMLMK
jgi:hypothetical protein